VKDLLIGLAVLSGIALFVYGLVRAGRQQRRQRGDVFRSFAESRGWESVAGNDAALRCVLDPFEGIGIYRSSSLGEVAPQDVVSGEVELGRVWTFWHWLRINGGALQFYACMLAGPALGSDGLIVRFAKGRSRSSLVDICYGGRRDRIHVGPWELQVFETVAGSARRLLSAPTARSLAGAVERLPWTVDLQIRRGALGLYTISRDLDLTTPEELSLLTDVTCEVGRILASGPS
jgi:hypothetical protein